MKIIISTTLWGKDYYNIFLKYNLTSLLFENVENLQCDKLTFLILLNEKLANDLKAFLNNINFSKKIQFQLITFEELQLYQHNIPHKYDVEKYKFLNACQNYFFQYSIDKKYDYHILNYPDFVWSKESLTELINFNFNKNKFFAFTGFCLPVNKSFLNNFEENKISNCLSIHNFNRLALENLHQEVLIREWNRKHISSYPSFLFWRVNHEGILLRSFHKHLIAYKVHEFKKNFNEGITIGTLDSDFILKVQKKLNTKTFLNPDNFNLVSIHDTNASSMSVLYKKKEEILNNFTKNYCTKEHIRSFEECFYFKRNLKINLKKWEKAKKKSIKQVKNYLISTKKIKGNYVYDNSNDDFSIFKKKFELKIIQILKKKLSYYNILLKIMLKNLYLKSVNKHT